MPADANAYGDIFGGWLLSLMDNGAGLTAARRSKGRAVTVAMDGDEFHPPVKVGDEVSVYAEIERVGRTSMTIAVEAWRRAAAREERDQGDRGEVHLRRDRRRRASPRAESKQENSASG